MAMTGPEQKWQLKSPALNEKLRYCWLNSNKVDGSDKNGMAIKMAERREKRHGNPSSENNSGETAIATARENSKIENKQNRTMT